MTIEYCMDCGSENIGSKESEKHKKLDNGQLVCPLCGFCVGPPDSSGIIWPCREIPTGKGCGVFAPVCSRCGFLFYNNEEKSNDPVQDTTPASGI